MNYTFKTITAGDDAVLAKLVRQVLTEFGINRPGTAYTDPTTDHLSRLYTGARAQYWVVTVDEKIVGGAGIRQLEGANEDVCELQRVFLLPGYRGKGIAKNLIIKALQFAKDIGFKECYLETTPELSQAIGLYLKLGFYHLDQAMGNTGHFTCTTYMLKDLLKD